MSLEPQRANKEKIAHAEGFSIASYTLHATKGEFAILKITDLVQECVNLSSMRKEKIFRSQKVNYLWKNEKLMGVRNRRNFFEIILWPAPSSARSSILVGSFASLVWSVPFVLFAFFIFLFRHHELTRRFCSIADWRSSTLEVYSR